MKPEIAKLFYFKEGGKIKLLLVILQVTIQVPLSKVEIYYT